jgi:YidC/Oxa1 family membrane protein insertase
VLLYWTTSNLWTMGQQFYVIRNNPAPGTPAAKAAKHGVPVTTETVVEPEPEPERPATPPRQQPKKQSREKRKKSGGARPANKPTTPEGEQK